VKFFLFVKLMFVDVVSAMTVIVSGSLFISTHMSCLDDRM
jgi:hypothetical protein